MRKNSLFAMALASTLMLSACGGGTEGEKPSEAGSEGSGADGVTELVVWGWPVGTDKMIEEFNASHPNIKVKHTDAGGGDDSAAKLLTAVRSGDAPDVSMVEFTTLPSLIVAGAVADITDGVEGFTDAFTEGTWAQVTFDDVVYGVPLDVGPAAMIYNAKAFEEYGAPDPVTWEDYRAGAAAIRKANPDAYIGSFPSSELGFWASVAAQAGSQWWVYENDGWTVNIGDNETKSVANFFEDMFKEDLITTEGLLTAEYNAKLNRNEMLSWPSALWATGVVQGVAEESQQGNWRMAPLPQREAGDSAVAYQGGSAMVVTSTTEKVDAALEFIEWFNASEEGAKSLISNAGSYPASIVGQDLTTTLEEPPLVEGQEDYFALAAQIASNTVPVSWGPNVSYAKTVLEENLSAAILGGTSWADAFAATEDAVKKDLETQGYKVNN